MAGDSNPPATHITHMAASPCMHTAGRYHDGGDLVKDESYLILKEKQDNTNWNEDEY